jgi:hypothetical protein
MWDLANTRKMIIWLGLRLGPKGGQSVRSLADLTSEIDRRY